MPRRSQAAVTERDEAILVSLFKYGVLTTRQIQTLHFPSMQTTSRRLRRLCDLGYVHTAQPLGIAEQIGSITPSGAALVAAYLGVEVEDLSPLRRSEYPIADTELRVRLTVNDLRIAITHAYTTGPVSLDGFIDGHHEYVRDTAQRRQFVQDVVTDVFDRDETIAHAPDAVFALEDENGPHLYFVEVDRKVALDVRSANSVVYLLDFYESLWASNEYQRYCSTFRCPAQFTGFHVVLLTPTVARGQQIARLVRRQSFARRVESYTLLGDLPAAVRGDIATYRWTPLRPTQGATQVLLCREPAREQDQQITPLRQSRSRDTSGESIGG